jgi:hypothetical protein
VLAQDTITLPVSINGKVCVLPPGPLQLACMHGCIPSSQGGKATLTLAPDASEEVALAAAQVGTFGAKTLKP